MAIQKVAVFKLSDQITVTAKYKTGTSSLLNQTYRNSQLSTNLTALSHDSSLPTIGRDRTRAQG